MNRFKLRFLIVAVSGLGWLAVRYLNYKLMAFSHFSEGIDLIYLPAGFRMVILMIGGVWAAAGIALVDPLTFFTEFQSGHLGQAICDALIGSFGPYAALAAGRKLLGIDSSLWGLRPIHLPVLALTVAVTSPLLLSVVVVFYGTEPLASFPESFCAMAFGDYLGIVIVVATILLGIKVVRYAKARRAQRWYGP